MEPFTLLSLILILIVALKITLQITKNPRHKNLPPTPPSLPIIGHLHHLTKTPLHRILHSLTQKHGSGGGVLFLRFGTRRVVVISSSAAAEECFTKNDIVLANRPPLLMGKHIGYNHTSMVASPYSDHWRNLRRIGAVEIFSSSRLNTFLALRRDEVKRLMLRINRTSQRSKIGMVELKSAFPDLTFNVIMRMVAGKRYFGEDVEDEGEAGQFRELISEVFENAGAGNPADFLPILNWIPDGYEKRIERLAKRADAFLQKLVDERRSCKDESCSNTMIDHLLSLQESQPDYYTDLIIKGLIMVLLLAATDTSAVTLEWAMSNLLNHPQILAKAKAEVDAKVGKHKLVEESDLSKLPYLQNIISETLRLFPAAPLLLPHYSSADCTIGCYNVPGDTILLVNAWAIHRDPKLWDEPDSFRPERFKISESELSYKLIPFGVGRRSCPGVGLAQRIVGLTLASLIQCFEWDRVSEENIDMSEGKGLTMPKAIPLEAFCKPRPIMQSLVL